MNKNSHQPIEKKLGHPADFSVSYHFFNEEEGGRAICPCQGYRSDFWYEYENHVPTSQYMIWPEFEDIHGEIILDKDKTVPQNGTARMWIVMSKMRQYHIGKLQVGTKGYFMEGERKVAECEVIELIGLNFNPVD